MELIQETGGQSQFSFSIQLEVKALTCNISRN